MILEGIIVPNGVESYLHVSDGGIVDTSIPDFIVFPLEGPFPIIMVSVHGPMPLVLFRCLDMIRDEVRDYINAYLAKRSARL